MIKRQGLAHKAAWTLIFITLVVALLPVSGVAVYAQSKSAVITSLSTDKTSYAAGEQVTVILVVRNTGDSDIQIQCNIVITNPAGNQQYNYSRKNNLAAGATGAYEFYWTVPANSQTGNYQVQSTVSDGKDSRFYSSRTASFTHQSSPLSSRSASLLDLSANRQSLVPGDTVTFSVYMQNTGGTSINLLVSVEVINPSGVQVYNGVRETQIERGYTDKIAFLLPIPDTADIGTYQAQATIADKIDGKLYGSRSVTLYVQTAAQGVNPSANKSVAAAGLPWPGTAFSGWMQYLIIGLLIALAAIVIYILARNRTRTNPVLSPPEIPENPPEKENNTDVP